MKTIGAISPVPSRVVKGPVVRGRKNPLYYLCGKRLRLLREAIGISQTQLARAAGTSSSSISKLEGLVTMMELDTVEQLAAALSVSPGWLAYGPEGSQPFRQKIPHTEGPPMPYPRLVQLTEPSVRYRDCPARLALTRERLGWSFRAVEDASGISIQAIINTEEGVTVPKIQTLEAIALGLGVSPGWLGYGDGAPPLRLPAAALPRSRHSRTSVPARRPAVSRRS